MFNDNDNDHLEETKLSTISTSASSITITMDDDETKKVNDTDFQRRNIGQLNLLELEQKYDHFYFVGQSIAVRVGTLDLNDRKEVNKKTETQRRASFVAENGSMQFVQNLREKLLGRELKANGRTIVDEQGAMLLSDDVNIIEVDSALVATELRAKWGVQ